MEKEVLKSSLEEQDEPKTLDMDKVLKEEIGEFGRYQLRILIVAIVTVSFISWSSTEFIFNTARIKTRCLIPECETAEHTQFSPNWTLNAIPAENGIVDSCTRFAVISNSSVSDDNTTCPTALFDRNVLVPCEEYVYENKDTVVYDFNLGCDEWSRSLLGTSWTLGALIAQIITGIISDRWGRRVALCINSLCLAIFGLSRYWAKSYLGFSISQFFQGSLGAGAYSSMYILTTEITGPRYRVIFGAMMSTIFSLGHFILGLIAWRGYNWRQLTLIVYIPQLITVFYYFVLFESVRWYMTKGYNEKAEVTLKKIARINRKQLSVQSLKTLRHATQEEKKNVKQPWLLVLVFRHKPILFRCLVCPVWWISVVFIYYGMAVYSVNMPGNKFINYLAVSFSEIPGYWTAFALLDRLGRKPVIITGFWVCAVCQVVYLFISDGHPWISLTVYLIAKCCISAVISAQYLFTAELFPTEYRHRLFAFCSAMGRLGSVLAPLTPAFGPRVPFFLFAGVAVLSGSLTLLMPETLGRKLPETIEEAVNMDQKKRTSD